MAALETKLEIRQYQVSDNEIVWDLHHRALGPTGALLKDEMFNQDLWDINNHYLNNRGEFLIGMLEGKVVCMGALRKKTDSVCEIKRMRVYPEYQRRSFGQQMLTKLEERAGLLGYTCIVLDTTNKQIAAQKLYKKNGYSETHRGAVAGLEVIYYEKKLENKE